MYCKENKYNEIGKDVYEVLILLLCGVFSVCCFFFGEGWSEFMLEVLFNRLVMYLLNGWVVFIFKSLWLYYWSV